MRDPREQELARLLVHHSVELKPGEQCLVHATDVPVTMVEELVDAIYAAGGYPQVQISNVRIDRAMIAGCTEESLAAWADCDAYRMARMQAFIGIRGVVNPLETSALQEQQQRYMNTYYTKVHRDIRVPKTKWVVLRYPNETMAFQAGLSSRDFEDFYYRVTTGVDYVAMGKAMEKAKAFLDATDKVRIVARDTDLSFSIKGMTSVPCAGKANIPDGEIYSCPIKESVNGCIAYNTPSTYQGHRFTDVRFVFDHGRIVEASADDVGLINSILDSDEGARYIGEFALGCNPAITFPMDNTLFDEKIAGSIHFTPGNAYEDCDNGNRSAVHWDLVQIQTEAYGGGEIWMDGVLIRKDGKFVHEAFADLDAI